MAGSITFQRGPLRGWHLDYRTNWVGGERTYVSSRIEAPYHTGGGLWGGMTFRPGVEGWAIAERAEWPGGVDALLDLADLLIETLAGFTRTRYDIDPGVLDRWRALAALADDARADFHARFPDGVELPFQVVACLMVQVTE